ncbi:AAA family ATPase, partial [Photobacterium sanctipauli]
MSIIEKALKKQGAKQPGEKELVAKASITKAMAQKKSLHVEPTSPQPRKEKTSTTHPEQELPYVSKKQPVSTPAMVIDTQKLKAAGMVSHDDDSTNVQINTEYRSIKQKLLYNAFGPASGTLNHSNMVMITSARPSEGKTFTAVNLAMSVAAEKDKTILLVDADVLKPSISATLGVDEKPGLIDYLLGDVAQLSDVIYSTNIPNLRVLPAGS